MIPAPDSLLRRLIHHRVEFVIVGGVAAVTHGSTLVTLDLDVCCAFTTPNLMLLQEALHDLHPVHRLTPRRLPLALTEATCRGLKNLYLDTELGVLDCLGAILGIGDFAVVKRRSVRLKLPAGWCRVLALDALIEAKRAMGRPRDEQAAIQLAAIQEKKSRRRRPRP